MRKKKSIKKIVKNKKIESDKKTELLRLKESRDDVFGSVTVIKIGTALTALEVFQTVHAGPTMPPTDIY